MRVFFLGFCHLILMTLLGFAPGAAAAAGTQAACGSELPQACELVEALNRNFLSRRSFESYEVTAELHQDFSNLRELRSALTADGDEFCTPVNGKATWNKLKQLFHTYKVPLPHQLLSLPGMAPLWQELLAFLPGNTVTLCEGTSLKEGPKNAVYRHVFYFRGRRVKPAFVILLRTSWLRS